MLTNLNLVFQSGYSPETQLAVTIDDLTRKLDRGHKTDVIILDFSKAFDTVPHYLLIHKLHSYDIRGQLLELFKNYLKQTMKVIVDGEASSEAAVVLGVPEGTV